MPWRAASTRRSTWTATASRGATSCCASTSRCPTTELALREGHIDAAVDRLQHVLQQRFAAGDDLGIDRHAGLQVPLFGEPVRPVLLEADLHLVIGALVVVLDGTGR